MRKSVQFALIAVTVLLIIATLVLFMRYQKASADYADMKVAEEAARSRYAETIDAIAEIQDSLNAISVGEETARLLSRDLQTEQQLAPPSGRQALDRIAALRASIDRSREMIRQLEANLQKSGIKVRGLERMVANLKHSVTQKEGRIAQLSTRVDSLQTQVTGLVAEVQENEETIEEKRREVATVYYIMGRKKELTTSGVVVAKGGVLGIGKTLQTTGHIDEGLFTPLDTDQETVVRIPATKAQVLSPQPATSYELKPVDGGLELHIVNPTAFRKVKQLVILTA